MRWTAKNGLLYGDGMVLAHVHEFYHPGMAAFLAAAANHFQTFLGEVKQLSKRDDERQGELF